MALIRRWLGESRQEQRALAPSSLALLGGVSATGVSVSEEGALHNTAVLACVRLLANSTAMLPLPVYRRIKRGKAREYSHPLYPLLQDQANPEMSAFELRRWLMVGTLLWGNGFAEIEWSESGQVVALWPLRPDQMGVERRGGALIYHYWLPTGGHVELPAYRVLHLRGLTGDGLLGYSVIRELMRESVGLGLATQEFGARFFGNGARPGIVLTHPGQLSDKAMANLKASWASTHEGLSNAHRLRILEEGMKVETIGIPPDEAQFLETRKFQVTEIARAFGVPPHMVGDLDRATFSNIEHQGIEFGQYSLYPHLAQIEQAINNKCLTADERRYLFVEHVTAALVRTDIKTRYEAHQIAVQNGWMTRNEVRALENLNAVEGGDTFLIPMNMQLVAPGAALPGGEAAAGVRALAPVLEDGARRLARREEADRRRGRTEFEDELVTAAREVFAPSLAVVGVDAEGAPWAGLRGLLAAPATAAERQAQITAWLLGWLIEATEGAAADAAHEEE